MTDKEVAAKIGKAVRKNEAIKRTSYNLYTVKMPGYPFLPPFLAPDDNVALDCLKETASTVKEFIKSRLYKIGTFCLVDGRVNVFPNKRLVALKETK